MSFHTVTMFVRWGISEDKEICKMIDEFKTIPLNDRKKDERVINIVRELKKKWSEGTKIERLATLGWIEYDSISIFCEMIDNIDKLREEYRANVLLNGVPPELRDADVDAYEKAVWEENKKMKNRSI
jgi:hypothetical protein